MLNIHPQTLNFIYFHFLTGVVLITIFRLVSGSYNGSTTSKGTLLFTFAILLAMGLRPYNVPGVGRYFGDTINYYFSFMTASSTYGEFNYKDPGFGLFTAFISKYFSAGTYFFILSAFYIVPVYYAIKRLSPRHTFLLMLMFTTYFLFWANGVNGIRIGVASSWFLLGVTYKDKKSIQILLFALAVSFHLSIILPVIAYVLTFFYTNSKAYFVTWFTSIGLSLLLGGFWEKLFAGFDVGDERFSVYLTSQSDADVFAYTGFRWDFLLYSSIPVVLGAFYLYKKNFNDKFYSQILNTYLIANSFWILVIRSNFSNRFASLSWFLIPIIILLPLLKDRLLQNQESKIGLMLFFSFVFTYFMSFKFIWN